MIGHRAASACGTSAPRARTQIEALLGKQVFLSLRVKVAKEWQRDPKAARPARVRRFLAL